MATLEIDDDTFDRIVRRAEEHGLPPGQFVAAMSRVDEEAIDLAELERRSAAVAAGGATVPHEMVARWLATWGTQDYRPWCAFPRD